MEKIINSSNIETKMDHLDPRDSIQLMHGYYMMFSSMLFFHTLNWIVAHVGTPKSVCQPIDEPWRWRNLFISWIHASICSVWTVSCFILYPEMLDDLVGHISYFTYLLIPFSTGYFVYDFIDIIVCRRLFKNWEVTLHHISVILMFWFDSHQKICIGYNVVALLAEVNSFFLHSRKLLQMSKVSFHNLFYRIVAWLNLASFLYCRGWSVSRIVYGMLTEAHRVPTFYMCCLCFSMFFMTVVNPILFWRLFKNDVLRYYLKKPKPKMNGNNNTNLNHIKAD